MIADDDDTHICLKCRTTIHGLDNYVAHRKSRCGGQTPDHAKPRILSPLIPQDEPDLSLKADDFFSLLELQSSSKKATLQVASGGKTTNSGVLTRSKATAVIQASNLNRASDWIGGHQLRELGNEDNQTKLINAVDSISGHMKKDDPPRPPVTTTTRLTYHDDLDDESNDDFEDEEEEYEDEEVPASHTGGKWTPSSPIQWLRPSSSHSDDRNSDWENPPPSYTGGKWKPTPPTVRRLSNGDEEEDKNVPPPHHTKGKWIPGRNIDLKTSNNSQDLVSPLRKSSGTVQYWCGACNRYLASKLVFDRHLKSDLHHKRTFHERAFENAAAHLICNKSSQDRAEGKRKIKKPNYLLTQITNNEKNKEINTTQKPQIKTYLSTRCEVCRSKVLSHLMGKHLISHYHCRKRYIMKPISEKMVLENIHGIILQSPFQCSACRFYCNEEAQFLNHWQSNLHRTIATTTKGVFFCTFCQYESKYSEIMHVHLLSEAHREVVSVINRSVPIIIRKIIPLKCESCRQVFRFNAELRRHCKKTDHALTSTSSNEYQNKHCCTICDSVFKNHKALQRHFMHRHDKKYYYCTVCSSHFDSEQDINVHRTTTVHISTYRAQQIAKNSNRERHCQYCYAVFSNTQVLKTHLQKHHPDHSVHCPKCGKKFTFSQEVSKHVKDNACSFKSIDSNAIFKCTTCPYQSPSEGDYMFHVALHKDPIYIYDKGTESTSKKKSDLQYKCPVCEKIFRKTSLRCHIRLHTKETPFKCEFCSHAYARKSNLIHHMKRFHKPKSSEFIIPEFFEKNVNRVNKKEQEHKDVATSVNKKYLCSTCGKNFQKKHTLQQHMQTHTGKKINCKVKDCYYGARTNTELIKHMYIHSSLKPFKCSQCEYSTKTKLQLTRHLNIHQGEEFKKIRCQLCNFTTRYSSHMKRHIRRHTGAKPYKCPHCEFNCNTLENLRKHVLGTTKHPGKYLYECSFCCAPKSYYTNYSSEFKVHLINEHSNKFASIKDAAAYSMGIYDGKEDSVMTKTGLQDLFSYQRSSAPPPPAKKIPPSTTVSSVSSTIDAVHSPVNTEILLANQETSLSTTIVSNDLLSITDNSNASRNITYIEEPITQVSVTEVPTSGTATDNWFFESATLYEVESDILSEHFDEA